MSNNLIAVNFLVRNFDLFTHTHKSTLCNVYKASTEPNGWVWVTADVLYTNWGTFNNDDNIIQKDISSLISPASTTP